MAICQKLKSSVEVATSSLTFKWENIPREENGYIADDFPIAPDWIIEILSPGQNQTKVTQKILNALEHGTEIGWLIDPEADAVIVYFQEGKIALFTEESEPLPVPSFIENFQLNASDIFTWLTVESQTRESIRRSPWGFSGSSGG